MITKVMQNQTNADLDYSEIVLWLDFYSQLLTPRTREVLELHYNEDMSLSEIAEHLGITRQGVHDKIIKGVSHLRDYETKLGLCSRFVSQKKQIAASIEMIQINNMPAALTLLIQLHDSLD